MLVLAVVNIWKDVFKVAFQLVALLDILCDPIMTTVDAIV